MRFFATLLLLIALVCLCGPAAASGKEAKRPLKIGFVYVSPVGEAGWSYAHDVARLKLGMDPNIITYLAESIADGPDSEEVIRRMSGNGYDIIVATSFNYMDTTLKVAADFPDITYLHCAGYKTAPNVSNFFGRMYQARYLSGLVAGSMTKSNIIGFVAAHPIPEVIRGINSFTLGARASNPAAEVHVIWTHTWYDPVLERNATLKLVRNGADVIAQDQDSPTPQVVAQECGVYSVGYNSDMSSHAPEAHLVSALWDWSVFYREVVGRVRAGTWKSGSYWQGIETGIVDISSFGPMIPPDVRGNALARRQEIIDGVLNVFQGPVLDQEGRLRIPHEAALSDKELLEMDWFVLGVVGSPKEE